MPSPLENDRPLEQPLIDRDGASYAWALEQTALLRRRTELGKIDTGALAEFLEEWADEMLAAVRSQLVNMMAHAAKAALSRNPDVVGHWRSECIEFTTASSTPTGRLCAPELTCRPFGGVPAAKFLSVSLTTENPPQFCRWTARSLSTNWSTPTSILNGLSAS
jgi:hypothetical protein